MCELPRILTTQSVAILLKIVRIGALDDEDTLDDVSAVEVGRWRGKTGPWVCRIAVAVGGFKIPTRDEREGEREAWGELGPSHGTGPRPT